MKHVARKLIELAKKRHCPMPCDLPDRVVSLYVLEAKHADWLLIMVGCCDEALNIIDEETIRRCVERYPETVFYWGAWEKLSRDVFDRCVELAPDLAMIFASRRLTDHQVDWCAQHAPKEALYHLWDRLTPERLDWCAESEPETAMHRISCIGDRLPPERIRWLMRNTSCGRAAKWLADSGFIRNA